MTRTATEAAQLQLDAYNDRDLERFLTAYAQDAVIRDFKSGDLILEGMEAMRERYGNLFENSPDLHCELRHRIVKDDMVIDHEHITGRLDSDPFDAIAIYQVVDGLIQHIWFIW